MSNKVKEATKRVSGTVAPRDTRIPLFLVVIRCAAFFISMICIGGLIGLLLHSKATKAETELVEIVKSGYWCLVCVTGAFVFGVTALLIFLLEILRKHEYVLGVIVELMEDGHSSECTLAAEETDSDGQDNENFSSIQNQASASNLENASESHAVINSDLVKPYNAPDVDVNFEVDNSSTIGTPEHPEIPVIKSEECESSVEQAQENSIQQ